MQMKAPSLQPRLIATRMDIPSAMSLVLTLVYSITYA